MTGVIVVAVTLTFDESKTEELVDAADRVAVTTRDEEGCITYEFFAAIDHPGRMLLFEEWESRESLDAHLASPHLAEFRSFLEAADITRDLKRYEVVGRF